MKPINAKKPDITLLTLLEPPSYEHTMYIA
jgi:hypothetical protein